METTLVIYLMTNSFIAGVFFVYAEMYENNNSFIHNAGLFSQLILAFLIGLPFLLVIGLYLLILKKPILYLISFFAFYYKLYFTKEFNNITDQQVENIKRYVRHIKQYKKPYMKTNIKRSKLMLKKSGINPDILE